MDAMIAKNWVRALRSGKYQQGDNFLRVADKYCALGVLVDMMDPEGWVLATSRPAGVYMDPWDYERAVNDESDVYAAKSGTAYVPGGDVPNPTIDGGMIEWTPEWFDDSVLGNYPCMIEFTSLNDDFGWNFDTIADFIENNLEAID